MDAKNYFVKRNLDHGLRQKNSKCDELRLFLFLKKSVIQATK